MSLSVFNPSLRNLSTFYLVFCHCFEQWRIQERGPRGPPLFFLDQTEARRAENIFLGDRGGGGGGGGGGAENIFLGDAPPPPPQHTTLSPLRLITCHHYGWRCRGP